MAVQVTEMPHPNLSGLEQLEAVFEQIVPDGWSRFEPSMLQEVSRRLMRLESRLKAHQLAAARALDASGAAKAAGATSTGDLLAKNFGGDRAAGDRLVRTAKTLESAPATQDALAHGSLSEGQATVIATALNRLPHDTSLADRQACEDTLLGDASRYTLTDLRRRADRITDVFKPKPEVDADENELLVARERAARAKTEFWMVDQRDGTHKGGFILPDAEADMLRAAIEAISAPRRDHLRDASEPDSVFDRDLEHRHRLGLGLAELCTHLPTDGLPSAGGVGATLMVRIDHESLIDSVNAATLSTGTRISAGQARKLACRLGILPAVFGGDSLPLDLGRERRFSKAQRRAMENRDGGCSFPGCDRPPAWCEAHHARESWAAGGTTDLDDGVLICSHHHHLVHDRGWSIRFHPDDGIPEYRAPGTTTWKRNHRWRP